MKRYRGANPQSLDAARLPDALLTIKTAATLAGLSPSTLYRKAQTEPDFPRFIHIGARCTRIRAGDFTAWLNSLAK